MPKNVSSRVSGQNDRMPSTCFLFTSCISWVDMAVKWRRTMMESWLDNEMRMFLGSNELIIWLPFTYQLLTSSPKLSFPSQLSLCDLSVGLLFDRLETWSEWQMRDTWKKRGLQAFESESRNEIHPHTLWYRVCFLWNFFLFLFLYFLIWMVKQTKVIQVTENFVLIKVSLTPRFSPDFLGFVCRRLFLFVLFLSWRDSRSLCILSHFQSRFRSFCQSHNTSD